MKINMSNEISFTGMKEYLKTLGKFLFWNFLSVAILGSFFYFESWALMVSPEVKQFIREPSLLEISLTILLLGILIGIFVLGARFFVRGADIWYKHPDAKERKLLVSSDLITSICCWILVVCCWSYFAPTVPLVLLMWVIAFFIIKFVLPLVFD